MGKNTFVKAKREMTYMKQLVISPSGGGKSYTSLRMASGFSKQLTELDGKEHRIAYINTEANRGKLYADEFDYDILDLMAPFEPENYIDAIDEAINLKYDIIIIDSLSHEWSGSGGCLEIHANLQGKDSYMNWGKVTPRHEKFMNKIIDSPVHIFATVRGKDAYERSVDARGKVGYEKVAMGYDQRNKLEYLFITSFMIDLETHRATATKDNTKLFTMTDRLSEKHGKDLCNWAYNTTQEDVLNMKKETQAVLDDIKSNEKVELINYQKEREEEGLSDIIGDIVEEGKYLASLNRRDEAFDVIKNVAGVSNPNKITNRVDAEKIRLRLKKMKEEAVNE